MQRWSPHEPRERGFVFLGSVWGRFQLRGTAGAAGQRRTPGAVRDGSGAGHTVEPRALTRPRHLLLSLFFASAALYASPYFCRAAAVAIIASPCLASFLRPHTKNKEDSDLGLQNAHNWKAKAALHRGSPNQGYWPTKQGPRTLKVKLHVWMATIHRADSCHCWCYH